MKHIKKFNQLFEDNINEDTPDMVGKKIKKIDYNVRSGELEIHLPDDKIICLGCEGGNVVSLYSETVDDVNDLEQFDGLTIKSVIRLDPYSVEITFDNNKSIVAEDDTGGEGLSVYKKED